MSTPPEPLGRSYGCSWGCGNPFDYVVVSVADSSTELLCLPCFVRLATDLVAAVTDPAAAKVRAALEAEGYANLDMTPGPRGKPRGHNAPANTDDPDLITAYDDLVTVDELPEEFK